MPDDVSALEALLDHFKVYKQYIYTDQKPTSVRLKGQFDQSALPAEIDHMVYFANPVSKNRVKPVDRNAHLAFYELHGPPEPRRVVVFCNQFGLQKILIGQPRFLLVPSEKVERGSAFPKKLDHFKAYEVLEGRAIDRTVLLADQVDKRNKVVVERPSFFCVPVAKTHKDQTFKVQNPRGHLTFYSITPKIYRVPKPSRDQFGDHKLLLATSVYLGSPTVKLAWDPIG